MEEAGPVDVKNSVESCAVPIKVNGRLLAAATGRQELIADSVDLLDRAGADQPPDPGARQRRVQAGQAHRVQDPSHIETQPTVPC